MPGFFVARIPTKRGEIFFCVFATSGPDARRNQPRILSFLFVGRSILFNKPHRAWGGRWPLPLCYDHFAMCRAQSTPALPANPLVTTLDATRLTRVPARARLTR